MTSKSQKTPVSISDVLGVWQSTLHIPDPCALLVTLATVVANRMDGDPLWTMLIGPPASGKTEIANALLELPEVRTASTVTKAGLLTGSRSKEGTGGLLREIGDRGLIVFPDLTTLLSETGSTRNEVFGLLREVYDGKVSRILGSGGGQPLKWRGHVGCLACVTEAIDEHDMSAFGERWVRFRLPVLSTEDRRLVAEAVLENGPRQREYRVRRRIVTERFLSQWEAPVSGRALEADEQRMLITLTDLGTRCRSSVVRSGGHHDEITLVPSPEEPARLLAALHQLGVALKAIGVSDEARVPILAKAALDGIHVLRRRILDVLIEANADLATSSVAGRCDLPNSTTRRHLEDLTALGVLVRTGDAPERWAASSWLRKSWVALGWTITAEDVSPDAGDTHQSLFG